MNIKKRTIGIGIVVGLLFFGWWFNGYLYINWNFHLFSLDSWRFLFNEIDHGWRVSNKADWIFLISFILVLPTFFGLWYWANKVHWRHSVKKGVRGVKNVSQKVISLTGKKQVLYPVVKPTEVKAKKGMVRPAKLTSESPNMMPPTPSNVKRTAPFSMPQQPASNWGTPVASPASPMLTDKAAQYPVEQPYFHGDEAFNEIAETPLSEVQLPQPEAVNEDIHSLLMKSGYQVYPGAHIGEHKVDWLALANNQIWVAIYDNETGDWLADEEAFNEEDPLWFSETDHRVSPVFMLQQLKKVMMAQLQEKNVSVEIQPVLIERCGNLINAEDMLKTWNDLKVIVCRTEVGGPVELPTVAEVLKDKKEPMATEQAQNILQIFNLGETVNG